MSNITTTSESDRRSTVWTIDAIRNLGATTDVETAGTILGIGRSKSYELAKSGQFPVRLLRIGRRYLVPIPSILEALGVPIAAPVPSAVGRPPKIAA